MKKPDFMKGRYGFDMLFFAVTVVCLIIVLLTNTLLCRIPHISVSGIMGVTGLAMIINTSRVFSKQISKRQAENIRFILFLNKLTGKNGKPGKYVTDNRGYTPLSQLKKSAPEGLRCRCGKLLDVPPDKGSHIVICPKCGERLYIKK